MDSPVYLFHSPKFHLKGVEHIKACNQNLDFGICRLVNHYIDIYVLGTRFLKINVYQYQQPFISWKNKCANVAIKTIIESLVFTFNTYLLTTGEGFCSVFSRFLTVSLVRIKENREIVDVVTQ